MKRLLFAVIFIGIVVGFAIGSPTVKYPKPIDSCACDKFACGCCLYMDVPQIWLNDTVCIDFAYDPDAYGISFVLTLDDKAWINETISAKDPPPICLPVPYIEDFVDVCVHFTDLDIHDKDFHGCVAIEFRMWWVYVVAEFKLGCFDTDKRCKKPIEQIKIITIPDLNNITKHNITRNREYKYNIVPMQDMNVKGENITDSSSEEIDFNFLKVTTVSPKKDIKFDITTIPDEKTIQINQTIPYNESLYFDQTFPYNESLHFNQTFSYNESFQFKFKRLYKRPFNHFVVVNRTIFDGLPWCSGKSTFNGFPTYILLLVVLLVIGTANLMLYF